MMMQALVDVFKIIMDDFKLTHSLIMHQKMSVLLKVHLMVTR